MSRLWTLERRCLVIASINHSVVFSVVGPRKERGLEPCSLSQTGRRFRRHRSDHHQQASIEDMALKTAVDLYSIPLASHSPHWVHLPRLHDHLTQFTCQESRGCTFRLPASCASGVKWTIAWVGAADLTRLDLTLICSFPPPSSSSCFLVLGSICGDVRSFLVSAFASNFVDLFVDLDIAQQCLAVVEVVGVVAPRGAVANVSALNPSPDPKWMPTMLSNLAPACTTY